MPRPGYESPAQKEAKSEERRQCGTKLTKPSRRGHTQCQNPAGAGTDHLGFGACSKHGGNSPSLIMSAAKEQAKARMGMGAALQVTPEEALLSELYRTAGHVRWLEEVIAGWGYNNPRELILQLDPKMGFEKAGWLRVYQDERAHLARVSKMAIDAGIAARLVGLAEQYADMINDAIKGILEDLDLNPADQRVRGVVARRMAALAAVNAVAALPSAG